MAEEFTEHRTRNEFHGTVGQSPIVTEVRDINYFYGHGAKKLLAEQRFDQQWLDSLHRAFVTPDHYELARKVLQERHRVVLAGPTRSGLHTAATMLLYQSSTAPQSATVESDVALADHLTDHRHGLLIDLRDMPVSTRDTVFDQLAALESELRATDSYAVVVTRAENMLELANHRIAPENIVWLDAPAATKVLAEHLNALDHPPRAAREAVQALQEPASPLAIRLHTLLRDCGPGRARILADLLRELARANPESGLEELFPQIEAGFHRWRQTLNDWYRTHPSLEDRALLVALAALDGAPGFVVAEEARELLISTGERGFSALDGEGLSARATSFPAQAEEERVRFTKPGYADAVLDHVWLDRPWLRVAIQQWLSTLPQRLGKRLDEELIDVLSRRLCAVTGKFGDHDTITRIARSWAGTRSREAARLLTNAALDPVLGRPVRATLKDWVSSGTPNRAVAEVVAGVCGGDLAHVYPQVCLTRLRHLTAVTSDDRVAEVGVHAVQRLAAESGLEHQVLSRIFSWCQRPAPTAAKRDGIRLFLRIADAPFRRPSGIFRLDALLELCWRHAMDYVPGADQRIRYHWHGAVSAWLDDALASPEPARALGILSAAAGGSGLRAAQLDHAARAWVASADGPESQAARTRLYRHLRTRVAVDNPVARQVGELLRSLRSTSPE